MTFYDIRTRLNEGVYNPAYVAVPEGVSPNHIFDENQTVKWNREKAASVNAARKAAIAMNRDLEGAASNLFQCDLVGALQCEYVFTLSRATKIYNRAYESGHSSGYYEVLSKAEDLAEFVNDILKD